MCADLLRKIKEAEKTNWIDDFRLTIQKLNCGTLALRFRSGERTDVIFREPNGNLLLNNALFGGSPLTIRLRCGVDLLEQQMAQRHVHTHTSQANVLGAVSATFNVTTRNRSQNSTDSDVQANARAALIQEATRRFPNTTDVTITNVARQNFDTWMDGGAVVLSVNYIATGQAVGAATHTQPHSHISQSAGVRIGTTQRRFISGRQYSAYFEPERARVREQIRQQAEIELRMAANNQFEGNIEVRNVTFHFVRSVPNSAGMLDFEYIAEGVVYRIR